MRRCPRPLAALLLAAALAACAGMEQPAPTGPDDAARRRVASVAEANGQPGVALSIYAIEATHDPGDAGAQARYASALVRAGGLAQADDVLTQALDRNPRDPALLNQAGRLRLSSGDAAGALRLFDQALAAAPADARAASGKGMALDLANRHAEALRWHAAAAGLAPDDLPIMNNYALSLLLGGDTTQALRILIPLARRTDAPRRVLNNLALAYAMTGALAASRDAAKGAIDETQVMRYVALIQSHSNIAPLESPE